MATRYITTRELSELGLLIEINRQILHPLGLALEVALIPADPADHGQAVPAQAVLRVQDHRDDPEGVYYGALEPADFDHVRAGQALLEAKAPERKRRLGFVVQPLVSLEAPADA